MDPHRKTKKDKKYPRVPIKTYKWEDIKRSRKRGGYPWTYLYKQPFNEQADPEPFTMNALRKSKSSSTVDRSEGVQISDVTGNDGCEVKMDTLQIVTEPDDRSARNSIGSLVIEECEMSDTGEADSQKPENVGLESADSSDNISQYLDKEERGPNKELELKEADVSEGNTTDNKENGDSHVEEQSKRKRKMSAESSKSRVSLTKEALLKKFNDTKNKIKIPKLTFPIKSKRVTPKSAKNVAPETKKELKKQLAQPKVIKPIYIHIPLKPPPGQTDEFSYLEFGETPKPIAPQIKGVGSFKLLAKNIKRLQETVPNNEQVPSIKENEATSKDDVNIITSENLKEIQNMNFDEELNLELDYGNEEDNEDDKLAKIEETVNKVEGKTETVSKDDAEVIVEDAEIIPEIAKELAEQVDKKGILKTSDEAVEGSSPQTQKGILKGKQQRAKSEEPEKKRKLSLESSYSRKSLSKLEFMKKLRETSQKIKKTFSSKKKKQPNSETTVKEKEDRPEKSVKQEKSKQVKPVYIHIPLKSSEGEKILEDESSQLSNSPDSPIPTDVQLIILTAPSDDEILDYHSSDVPETPSENQTFFENKIDELKKLAKDVVNGVTPSANPQKLEPVTEETLNDNRLDKDAIDDITPLTPKDEVELSKEDSPNDKAQTEETPVHNETDETILKTSDPPIREKMVIDVEDGLSESFIKDDKQEAPAGQTDLDEVIGGKSDDVHLDSTPTIKKKVSFRKRSKTSKDGSYEEIGPQNLLQTSVEQQKDVIEIPTADLSQSVSDDKPTDFDKSTTASFKEDEDKWSKMSDHEYEPVNPPPEVQIVFSSTPTLNFVEETNNLQSGNRYPEVPSMGTDLPVDNEVVSHRTEALPVTQKETAENIGGPTQQLDHRHNQDTHQTDKSKDPNKFQLAWKQTTNQFKNKIRNMKKPHTPEEDKPKSRKFKFERPKLNLPKIPDKTKIHLPSLPSFTLPHRKSEKRSLKQRQQSTESNAGDSKKISFDFSTYPRVFKKKPKPKIEQKQEEFLDLASDTRPTSQETSAKSWSGRDPNRVSLHSDESFSDENEEKLHEPEEQNNGNEDEFLDDDRMASHIRYKDDIDIDDEFESHEINNDEYLSRWNRGNFNPETDEQYTKQFENRSFNPQIDEHYPKQFENRGRFNLEINEPYRKQIENRGSFNPDQDEHYTKQFENRGSFNPELDARYVKQFENSRYEVTDLDFEEDTERPTFDFNSNHNKERYSSGSSFGGQRVGGVLEEINPDEFFLRQKGISQDNIEVGMYLSSEIKEAFRTPDNALSKLEDRAFHLNDSNQSLPEPPNKRKPIKKPKRKKTPHVSQERISHGESDEDDTDVTPPSRPKRRSKRKSRPKHFEDVIPYQETIPVETHIPAELSVEQGTSIFGNFYQRDPENKAIHENDRFEQFHPAEADTLNFGYIDETQIEKPAAPPRKHKSLKSLTSENDSILEEISSQIIQTPDIDIGRNRIDSEFIISTYPLKRPSRKKSRTSLQSRTSSQSKEAPEKDEEYLSSSSQLFTSENQTPCIEEPCIQDIRDCMGYAIIDKQKVRDPPLPPPRSPGRKKRSTKETESNFFTVPRQSRYDDAPVRPLRNYSTLGQTRKPSESPTYENKENIDITQYIEIEDEPNRDLQSGDVIKKMKDRPLPAPPRPPRKSRPLQNITSKENIMTEIKELTDTAQTPTSDDEQKSTNITEPTDIVQDTEKYTTEKHLITPDYFTHQETITHGSLLVQSLNGDKIIRDSEMTVRSQERIIPVSTESDDETSSVPEDFKRLKDPPQEVNMPAASPPKTEVEVLKAQRLQVVDLDVDTLTVNKLLAGKIIVSQIDSHGIRTDEIHLKSDNLSSGDINVNLSQPVQGNESITFERSQIEEEVEDFSPSDDNFSEEKKTSTNVTDLEMTNEPTPIHPHHVSYVEELDDDLRKENAQGQTDLFHQQNIEDSQTDPPKPPPRSSATNLEYSGEFSGVPQQQLEKCEYTTLHDVIQEPDVDDEPPPRPPQPLPEYVPSQPPASFYALRAQKYVDSVESNIPKIPRRKRPPKSVSRSSSEDSLVIPVSRRFYNRSPEPSISQLSGQLIRTCGSTAHSAFRRLITDITNNVKKNADGKLDLHVMTIILLILIAGLILLGYGEEKTVVHLHHWEFFNPPRDL